MKFDDFHWIVELQTSVCMIPFLNIFSLSVSLKQDWKIRQKVILRSFLFEIIVVCALAEPGNMQFTMFWKKSTSETAFSKAGKTTES